MSGEMRVGLGWDRHRLVAGRRLVLGGMEIPHDRGLEGHSDGDVLLHAVVDALLGAAGLGDIGDRFPPSDPKWKDADSRSLLAEALAEVRRADWTPVNVDMVLVAEAPRLGERKAALAAGVASLLGLPPGAANLKAKTAEGLGPEGAGECMEAHAVVLLARRPPS